MRKPAPTQHQVHELIQQRWSPRAFSSQPVPPEVLRSLFEAARWAPSSSNEQPWAFLVTTADDKENHAKMLSTLVEFNQAWAKHAPVLVIAVSELAFAKNGHPNRNAFYDTGAAVANLSVEATSRGCSCIKWRVRSSQSNRAFRNPHRVGAHLGLHDRLSGQSGNFARDAAPSRTGPARAKAGGHVCHGRALGKTASFLQK